MLDHPEILDNSNEKFQLKTFLNHHISSGSYTQLSIASGYWDLPGMVELLSAFKHFLEKEGTEVRFLIGEELKISKYFLDTKFPEKYIKADLSQLPFKEEFKETVDFLSRHLESGRIKVKLYKKTFLHAKCYIIGNESEKALGIIGSSNFTRNGLLGNTELNDIEYDHRIVNYVPTNHGHDPSHRSWFEKLWNDVDSIEWNRKFNMDILGLSQFGNLSYSPYEIYIRILYEIYKDDIEIEEESKTSERDLSKRNELTIFQKESVNKAKRRLNDRNIGMCLIGDSVGLGKSYIARDIIEDIGYYERNNVVIVCPASLRDDWNKHLSEITVNALVYSITQFAGEESIDGIKSDLLSNKRKSKTGNAIDLLVIDESHNLKTRGSQSFQNLMSVLSDPTYNKEVPKVLMLTATPVNNSVKDLANQILLAKGGDDSFFTPFGIPSIENLFAVSQKDFKKKGNEEAFSDLYPILNKIMVKRTKHQVKKDFPDALLNGVKINFPEEDLENMDYVLDNKESRKAVSVMLKDLEKHDKDLYKLFTTEITQKEEDELEGQVLIKEFFEQVTTSKQKRINQTEFESIFHFMDRAIRNLKLIPYSYLSEKIYKTKEEQDEANSRQNLTGVMKVTLFKAFDSSLHTFKKSIGRYENQLNSFKKLFFEDHKIVLTSIIQRAFIQSQDQDNIGKDIFTLIEGEIKSFRDREERKAKRKELRDETYAIQEPEQIINLSDFNCM